MSASRKPLQNKLTRRDGATRSLADLEVDRQAHQFIPSTYSGAQTEDLFRQFATDRGWKFTKRGWPDFLCISQTGEWFAVEVKRRRLDGKGFCALRRDQVVALDFMTFLGVRCFISDGVEIEPYGEKHRRGKTRLDMKKGGKAKE